MNTLNANQMLRKAATSAKNGQIAEARQFYESILDRYPANKRAQDALKQLGMSEMEARASGPLREEVAAFMALFQKKRFAEARTKGKTLVARHPNVALLHNTLGKICAELNLTEEAVMHHKSGLALTPDNAKAHNDLAHALSRAGRTKEAHAELDKALNLDPKLFMAHRQLSQFIKYTRDEPHLAVMEKILAETPPLSRNALELRFALGKAYNDMGEWDTAFQHYAVGNRIRKMEHRDAVSRHLQTFDDMKLLFGRDMPSVTDFKALSGNDKKMIFVLGMPRSGTTLVETILDSHSLVHGAGELGTLGRLSKETLGRYAPDIKAENMAALRSRYLEELPTEDNPEPYIVDKMPGNFQWIGFIVSAFPDAKIVRLRRDPIAVCWSIYKLYFPARGLDFAFDLEDLVQQYRSFEDLMDFWYDRYPGRIYECDYDKLTENQEEETRKLIDWCGLDWEDACLDFHTNKRVVKTASSLQVRKKLYKGSSEAWRSYEKHLGPLLKLQK